MSNVSDLKAALIAEAADITDDIYRLTVLSQVDEWYDAQLARAALAASKLSSYSISGRSVTYQQAVASASRVDVLWGQIMEALGRGGVVLADLRTMEASTLVAGQ